jgi:hypothetical protein
MSYLILNSRALIATTTVLKPISEVPIAGLSRIPALARQALFSLHPGRVKESILGY